MIFGIMTELNSSGREVLPCGSLCWVRLDQRKTRANQLAEAVEHFLKRKPYRVAVVRGGLRHDQGLRVITFTKAKNVHEVGGPEDFEAVNEAING